VRTQRKGAKIIWTFGAAFLPKVFANFIDNNNKKKRRDSLLPKLIAIFINNNIFTVII
jgi:hypothetical protein